jgi:ADP-heptose:LPS heptosyltransferase
MRTFDFAARAVRFVWWRGYASWAAPLADRLSRRWGWPARALRSLTPWGVPYRRSEVVLSRGAGLGDVLLCTPALREMKRRNPRCRVTFYTDFGDLIDGLPFVDRVRPMAEHPDHFVLRMCYERSLPSRRHLAQLIGDTVGVNVRDVRPSCAVRGELVEKFRQAWSDLPRPLIVVSRCASPWTPNKNWPEEYWEVLVERLAAHATVIDIGAPTASPAATPAGSYIDLRGQTTLPELVAAIAAADIAIAPDTGPMHVAAAFMIPTVVIYGGYISPDSTGYPGNINLYSPVECAPCWLREPCPFSKKCLHMITPDDVEAAVNQLLNRTRHSLPERPGELAAKALTPQSAPVGPV